MADRDCSGRADAGERRLVVPSAPLWVHVAGAVGGGVVVGNLAVDLASSAGFITAYPCTDGPPLDGLGHVTRADLNFDGAIQPVWSSRLVAAADANGDLCFYSSTPTALIVDVNAIADDDIEVIPSQRSDTRLGSEERVASLTVHVADAVGGEVVIGNLAVDRAREAGFVTAYPCTEGLPRDADGRVTRADLNFDGRVEPVWSNRLITTTDVNGDVCFYASSPVALIVDVNAIAGNSILAIPNARTDTRPSFARGVVSLWVHVDGAVGGRLVVGNLAVDLASSAGFVTAYPCLTGVPRDPSGNVARADLNFDGRVGPVWSSRLIATADANGDVCFYASSPVALIVDVNAIAGNSIQAISNERTDTRTRPL